MKLHNFPLNYIIKQIVAVNTKHLEESPLSASLLRVWNDDRYLLHGNISIICLIKIGKLKFLQLFMTFSYSVQIAWRYIEQNFLVTGILGRWLSSNKINYQLRNINNQFYSYVHCVLLWLNLDEMKCCLPVL